MLIDIMIHILQRDDHNFSDKKAARTDCSYSEEEKDSVLRDNIFTTAKSEKQPANSTRQDT